MPNCYYYDEQRNRCNCYVNENLDELLAENAKLRDGAAKMAQWYDEELKAALAENAKLRELVRALLTCATDGECDECRMNGATPWHVGEAQLCDEIWEHLRELGVEVDG